MREARISATRTWAQRFREYQPMDHFTEGVARSWRAHCACEAPPAWIVSDDYGLAAQLAYAWDGATPRLCVPADPLFNRAAAGLQAGRDDGVLVLGVQVPLDQVAEHVGDAAAIATLVHPVTGEAVQLGAVPKRASRGTPTMPPRP
jgi:hypothetical protein